MPGSWKEANQFKEIQYLIKQNKLDNLSFKTATWRSSEKQKVALVSGPRGGAKFVTTVKDRSTQSSDQNDSASEKDGGRDGLKNTTSNTIGEPRKKRYSKWSEERLAEELFNFSEMYSKAHGIPKIFFPT